VDVASGDIVGDVEEVVCVKDKDIGNWVGEADVFVDTAGAGMPLEEEEAGISSEDEAVSAKLEEDETGILPAVEEISTLEVEEDIVPTDRELIVGCEETCGCVCSGDVVELAIDNELSAAESDVEIEGVMLEVAVDGRTCGVLNDSVDKLELAAEEGKIDDSDGVLCDPLEETEERPELALADGRIDDVNCVACDPDEGRVEGVELVTEDDWIDIVDCEICGTLEKRDWTSELVLDND